MSGHYSRWEDAMVAQSRLLHDTLSPTGRTFIKVFQESLNGQHPPEVRQPDGFIHALQVVTLRDADPIYASHDITEVVDVAREAFKPEPIRATDPFTPFGFVLFP